MFGTNGFGRGALLAMAALLGCAETAPGSATSALSAVGPEPESPVAAPVEPSFDVADAIERARAAFSYDDGILVAGSETHRVEIAEGDDGFTFTPVHDRAAAAVDAGEEIALGPTTVRTSRLEAATPLTVRTESIVRGATRLDGDARSVVPVGGALAIDRGAVVEELENTRDGLEQRWRFTHTPAGAGDLVVRVDVGGMTHVGTTPSGEHFADAETGLGVVYGNATWIDADGDRFELLASWDGRGIVLTVPAGVVADSRFPAVLDPVLGPEISMDAPVTGPRGANQFVPAIASNGTDAYLLVFTDQLFGDDDVRGVRFGVDGTLMDATSFRIATQTGINESRPDVSWNGASWVVVWQDGRNGVDWDVYGTTVSAAGVVAMEDGAVVTATAGTDEQEVAIASAGSTSLVVYRSGTDAAADVLGTRLNATGAPTDTPFVVGGGTGVQNTAAVAATATEFLVTYTDDTDGAGAAFPNIRGRRLRATGTALIDGAPFVITSTNGFESQPAWGGGTSYMVVWTSNIAGFYAINASAIPVSGTVVPAPMVISPGAATRDYMQADLAWNGSSYLVAYTDAFYDDAMMAFTSYTIGARTISATGMPGTLIDPTSIVGDTLQVTVAAIGASFYLAYTDASGEGADVRGTRIVGTAPSSLTGQVLSSGPNDQTAPILGSSGTGFLAAWLDFRSSSTDVWGVTLSATGTVVGAPAMLVGGAGTQLATDIAWSGSRYVLVFSTADGNVRGLTVTAAGIATAPFDIAISTTLVAHQGSIACGPAALQCLVAWTEYDPGVDPVNTSVRAARLDASSASVVVGAAFNVAATTGDQYDPDVAAADTQFYVVWTDTRLAASADVRGSRVLGSALDAAGTIVGGAAGDQHDASVASDGTSFVVAFVDERNGGTRPNDVYSALITTGGGVSGATSVVSAVATDDEYSPSIAWNGRRYLVAYTQQNDTVTAVTSRRLAATGAVVDLVTPFVITGPAQIADLPSVVRGGADQWLIAYRTFAAGAARTRVVLMTDDPVMGSSCTVPTDCTGGTFCVDGVCCNALCAGGTTDCMACSVAAGAPTNGTCAPIAGCGDAGTTTTDGGTVDTDGGTTTTDGGTVDTDGGTTDTDGGTTTTDGGTTTTDGGGGSTDGGGGSADAGPRVDAGGVVTVSASCSCSVPTHRRSSAGAIGLLLALGATIAIRRRR